MNWYRKFSQRYEEINRDDYGNDEDGESDYRANQYFAIGQSETRDKSYCWIYINGQLHTALGRTHGAAFFNLLLNRNQDEFFKGWYDPIQKKISVVFPRRSGDVSKKEGAVVPVVLLSKLKREFGNDNEIIVF